MSVTRQTDALLGVKSLTEITFPQTSRSAEARLHQLAMVDTFIAENRRPDAIALLERITRTKKEGPGVQLKLGELYLETAQLDKCLKTLEEAER